MLDYFLFNPLHTPNVLFFFFRLSSSKVLLLSNFLHCSEFTSGATDNAGALLGPWWLKPSGHQQLCPKGLWPGAGSAKVSYYSPANSKIPPWLLENWKSLVFARPGKKIKAPLLSLNLIWESWSFGPLCSLKSLLQT